MYYCSRFRITIHDYFFCFMVSDDIEKGWIWGYWISPMMYAQNAVVNNEFLGKSWRHV